MHIYVCVYTCRVGIVDQQKVEAQSPMREAAPGREVFRRGDHQWAEALEKGAHRRLRMKSKLTSVCRYKEIYIYIYIKIYI